MFSTRGSKFRLWFQSYQGCASLLAVAVVGLVFGRWAGTQLLVGRVVLETGLGEACFGG